MINYGKAYTHIDESFLQRMPESAGLPHAERRATLLIVDDKPTICQMVARLLEPRGITVLQAYGGQDALDIFGRFGRRIDLVILDIVMPEMDGEAVFSSLRKANPDVRVLVSTGHPGLEEEARILAHKGTARLPKPYQPAELLLAVDSLIEQAAKSA
jgi:two-component system cell cycle sensor histidine kinase/response regulator CckA